MEKSDEEMCIIIDSSSESDSDVIFLEETKKRKLDLSHDGLEIISQDTKGSDAGQNQLDSSVDHQTRNLELVGELGQDQPDGVTSDMEFTSSQSHIELGTEPHEAAQTMATPITTPTSTMGDFMYDLGLSDNNGLLNILNSGRPGSYTSKSTSEGTVALNDQDICLNQLASGPTHNQSQTVSKQVHKVPSLKAIRCLSCPDLSTAGNTIQCVRGHSICKECIKNQTTLLLQRSGKGGLTCSVQECDEQFSTIDLEDMLPSMVIDILVARTQAPADPTLLKQMYADDDGMLGGATAQITKTGYEMFDVPTDSVEYSLVMCKFYDSMTFPKSEILAIKRVQNPILWKFFSMKKAHMKLENSNMDVTEELLFHGTSRKVMNAICKDNFDWRVSGTHGTVHGVGSYFAKNAGYSDKFTDQITDFNQRGNVHTCSSCGQMWAAIGQLQHPSFPASLSAQSPLVQQPSTSPSCPNCCKTRKLKRYFAKKYNRNISLDSTGLDCHAKVMFLARVLVGNYAQGSPTYRKPPPINPANPLGRLYDSCVDNYASPGIYVIFDTAQCYPEYIIEYKHN